jgi:hypothetical protein
MQTLNKLLRLHLDEQPTVHNRIREIDIMAELQKIGL